MLPNVTPDPVSPSPPSPSSPSSKESAFECNVCFDVPSDPVVTPCGHLYCWSCLYEWMRQRPDHPQCPVCKAPVDKRTVIPIYGRGRDQKDDPRDRVPDLPPRPAARRPAVTTGGFGPMGGFGMHQAAFGRFGGGGGGMHGGEWGGVSVGTFGLFPNLFGMTVQYPATTEGNNDGANAPANQEDDSMGDLVAKVFLLLTVFVAIIITTF